MKRGKLLIATAVVSACMSITALAGTWQPQENGQWKYLNDDGSYPVNCWQWIDNNADGIAESYYFDGNGYCLMNTITPDGYIVDINGAWVVDGIVQTQAIASQATQKQAATSAQAETATHTQTAAKGVAGISSSPYDGYTIVVNTHTQKYHQPSCSSVGTIKAANIGYSSDSDYLDSHGYTPCKKCH